MVIYYESSMTNELYHSGVKGMRWGVRRYQNKDGSLTPAGKKRRSLGQVVKDHRTAKKRKASLEKARATKAANKKAAEERTNALAKGKIKAKDMTNAELAERIKRLESEKRLKELVAQTETVSNGKKYAQAFLDRALMPAIQDAGKNILTKYLNKTLNDALNLDSKDATQKYIDKLNKKTAKLKAENEYNRELKTSKQYKEPEDPDEKRMKEIKKLTSNLQTENAYRKALKEAYGHDIDEGTRKAVEDVIREEKEKEKEKEKKKQKNR